MICFGTGQKWRKRLTRGRRVEARQKEGNPRETEMWSQWGCE